MSQTISLQVSTNLNELAKVLIWFEQLAHDTVPKDDWLKCKTALAEVFTNAVRHAHKNLPMETPIDLESTLSENRLEIKVFDFGAGFDLSGKLSSLNEVDINALGGRGLGLIDRMVDVFDYSRLSDGRNCLRLVKHYAPVN
ncbi:Serine-protein kinase RsbW [Tumidithrix helvetica PCC 7403]|uniref:ATP-binding protein n=1 Tax=Tumidithrix helvetica TaxID=3457545 RepID=UPI003CA656EB